MNALILLAHGSRDPLGAQPLAQIRAWVKAARPDLDVREAYLSLNQPTLEACLESLHHEGCRDAVVLPLLVSRGHHLNVELPVLLSDLQARFPALALTVGPHLGADAAIVDLVLARAAQAAPVGLPV
jgi:sirohydrochlorin ferrochelatase